MRVEAMMKPAQGCLEDDRACDCAMTMMKRNIGFTPVCDRAGKPVGAITDRDLALRIVGANRPADTKLSEVMTRDVVCCHVGDDLSTAEELMRDRHKARIMVCDGDGKLKGVISLSDVMEIEDENTAAETFRDVAERETHQPFAS